MHNDKPSFSCSWFDCSNAAEKGAIFGKRIFSEPEKTGVAETWERRNLCKAHLSVVHGTYYDFRECEADERYVQSEKALAAPA